MRPASKAQSPVATPVRSTWSLRILQASQPELRIADGVRIFARFRNPGKGDLITSRHQAAATLWNNLVGEASCTYSGLQILWWRMSLRLPANLDIFLTAVWPVAWVPDQMPGP